MLPKLLAFEVEEEEREGCEAEVVVLWDADATEGEAAEEEAVCRLRGAIAVVCCSRVVGRTGRE